MVNRDDAVLLGPSALTYGFADTCRIVMPEAKINNASKNREYTSNNDAG